MSLADKKENYTFLPAVESDLPAVFKLIDDRINWMDEVGLKQWNVTNYWECYPESYYRMRMDMGELYIMKDAKGNAVATAALIKDDYRWPGDKDAFHVHHLATAIGIHGIGAIAIDFCKDISRKFNMPYLRLDCAVGNDMLNNFYKDLGFTYAGPIVDRLYTGNKLEFKL